MKRLVWFKTGDDIPDSAVYIRSEIRRENIQYHETHPMLDDDQTWDNVEYHLYEVPMGGVVK